jgi:hypothetical protein
MQTLIIKRSILVQVFVDYLNEVNWLAVFVAALVAFFIGSIWYAKQVFGNKWQKEVGLTKKDIEKSNMTKVLTISFVTILISAVALSVLIKVLVLDTVTQGALLGIMLAVGIIATNKLMQVQYELRSWNYWFIVVGYDVVAYAVMGAILAVWI